MGIKTGRAEGVANVIIDYERCTVCGLCVKVCSGGPLYMENKKILIDQTRVFGCVGCGQCVTVCPEDCIRVEGRDLFPNDFIALPSPEQKANYEQLKSLMLARRSIRHFQNREAEKELIDKIVSAASTAPMGIPPSDVEVLVLNEKAKVNEFSNDVIAYMKKIKWMFSSPMLLLWRPFIGKAGYESFKSFLTPLVNILLESQESGIDSLLYNAPLAMYFYGSAYSDPADPLIAATYAMLAAESLGLGSCMIGTVGFCVKYSKKLKKKYGIPQKIQMGIMVIFGYPQVKHRKAINRRFAKVNFY
jgi:ferredoxin/nitroreductase